MCDAFVTSLSNFNNLVVRWEKDACSKEGLKLEQNQVFDSIFGSKYGHFQGYTKDNLHIEWSYYACDNMLLGYQKRQAYVLAKGEQGTTGHQGGFGGSGGVAGKGGHAGRVLMSFLNGASVPEDKWCQKELGSGKDGESKDGTDGAPGKPGSNGVDVGYMDSMWWVDKRELGPGNLVVESYSKPTETCCWCAHHGAWRSIKEVSTGRPLAKDQMERQRVRKTKEKLASLQKNAIDKQQILDSYASQVRQNAVHVGEGYQLHFKKMMSDVLQKNQVLLQNLAEEAESVKVHTVSVVKDAPSEEHDMNRKRRKQVARKLFQFRGESVQDSGNNKILELDHARIEACEKINLEMAPRWNSCQAEQVNFVKRPTSTEGNASALHALFGNKNAFGFFESQKSRREVCKKLKDSMPLPKDDIVSRNQLKTSLRVFFEDVRPNESNDKANPMKTLDKYGEEYNRDPEAFLWDQVLEDKKALQEYADFLAEPEIPILTSDMLLIAQISGVRVKLYTSHPGIAECFPLDNMDPYGVDVHIVVDTAHEFSRLEPVTKRDVREINSKKQQILDNLVSLKKLGKINEYVEQKLYLAPPKEDDKLVDEKKTDESAGHSEKRALITQISQNLCSLGSSESSELEVPRLEKLVVETELHQWPSQALQLFYCRVTSSDETSTYHSLRTAYLHINLMVSENMDMTPWVWVMAAFPIPEWELEMTLLVLEDYFEAVSPEQVNTWRATLAAFPDKLVTAVRQLVDHGTAFKVEDTADFTQWLGNLTTFELSATMDFEKLEDIGKSQWPDQLRRLYLEDRLRALPNVAWNESDNKQSQALYYLTTLCNEKRDTVVQLLEVMRRILAGENVGRIVSMFGFVRQKIGFYSAQKPCTLVTRLLANFCGGLWDLDRSVVNSLESFATLEAWMADREKKQRIKDNSPSSLRTPEEIHTLIKNDFNTTVDAESLSKIMELAKGMEIRKELDVVAWLEVFQDKVKNLSLSEDTLHLQREAVEVVNYVIRKSHKLGYHLRATQNVAILAALTMSAKGQNLLSQIAPGEGKTCIVLAVAIVRGLFGETTDVVTSSKVLAQRDATDYQDIYAAFGLTVGHVTSENVSERRRAYLCKVCYGEVSDFQRDYLLDRFYSQNIRGSRALQNLIADEVDSFFLDKANSVLYLSHQPPDLSSLEDLFVAIWSNVVRAFNAGATYPSAAHQIRDLIHNKIHPSVNAEDLKSVTGNKDHMKKLRNWLVAANVISKSEGRILITADQLSSFLSLPHPLQHFEQRLKYLVQRKLEAPGRIPMMKYLKPFVDFHLQMWIKSAFSACEMTEKQDYVVDVDRSKTCLDKDPRIIILDQHTGGDLMNSEWNEALHQFLQLKHGCRLSLLNLKAVFISNISYFKEYPRIFGVTGTMGTEWDREFLRNTYIVELLCMPLAQPKRFIEEEPQICVALSDLKDKVAKEIIEKVAQKRSVLAVCQTVEDAELIFIYLKQKLGSTLKPDAIELYRRDYEEFKAIAVKEGLPPGRVIVSTNLSGRGIDIKLSRELRAAGGLHVIVCYLPDNYRVEIQAFLRASRAGDPGSGRLIFVDKLSCGNTRGSLDAIDLKILRDELEMQRVSDINTYYQKVILKEEEVFKTFQSSFEKVASTLVSTHQGLLQSAGEALKGTWKKIKTVVTLESPEEAEKVEKARKMNLLLEGNFKDVKELIMYSMLDEWAYWLDRYSCHLLNDYRKSELGAKGLFLLEDHEVGKEDGNSLMQEFMSTTWRYENRMGRYCAPEFNSNIAVRLTTVAAVGGCGLMLSGGGGIVASALAACQPQVLESAMNLIFGAYPLDLIREPAMKIKMAKMMLQRGMPSAAEQCLEEVISADRDNSLVASYYKLACKMKKGEVKSQEFLGLVAEVEERLDERRMRQVSYASTIEQFKQVGNHSLFVGDGYRKQKEVMVKLLSIHRGALHAMVGARVLTPQNFAHLCDGDESVAEHLINFFLDEGAMNEAHFVWKQDPVKLRALADAFCVEVEKVEAIFMELSGHTGGKQRDLGVQLEKRLKKRLDLHLPGREDFWKEIGRCFEEKICFAVIASQGEKSAAAKAEPNEWIGWAEERKGKWWISKYGIVMGANSGIDSILKGSKQELMLQQKFRWLRKYGRVCFEECAIIDILKLKTLRLVKYHKVETGAFTIINGISAAQSEKIFGILAHSCIIDDQGELISVAEWTEKIPDLGEEFEVWRNDIWRVLYAKCRYKFELLHLLNQISMKEEESSGLEMSLPAKPAKDFVMAATELGFIVGRQANPAYFPSRNTIKSFAGDVLSNCGPLSWLAGWLKKKTGMTGNCVPILTFSNLKKAFPLEDQNTLQALCDDMLEKEWLKPAEGTILKIVETGKGQQLSGLVKTFPNMAPKMLREIWDASQNDGDIVYEINGKGATENELDARFHYHQTELLALVQWRQQIYRENFLETATQMLYRSQGNLALLENPDANLVDLETQFGTGPEAQQGRQESLHELNTMGLNAFDHTVNTVERTHTTEMITSAIFIVIFALAQFALGIWCETFVGVGTFVGTGFIAHGFSDIMYAYGCFRSGHFSWREYGAYKLGTAITTAVTVGVGALIAKGVQYSKYGDRIFGSWGKTFTRKEITGILSGPVVEGIAQRSLFQECVISFGYKVVQAAAQVSGTLAVSLIYEKALKQLVNAIGEKILKSIHNTIAQHPVAEDIGQLVQRVGAERVMGILSECQLRVQQISWTALLDTAHNSVYRLLSPIMSGVQQAIGKIYLAGQNLGKGLEMTSKIMGQLGAILTATPYLTALVKISLGMNKFLGDMQIEIRGALEREDGGEQQELNGEALERVTQTVVHQFQEEIHSMMKHELGLKMQYMIIEPLMEEQCQNLLYNMGRHVRGKMQGRREAAIRRKTNQVHNLRNSNTPQFNSELKTELELELVRLCSQTRDPDTIADIVENGGPLGVESVQALANMHNVIIEVDSDNPNVPKRYQPENGVEPSATLKLKHKSVGGHGTTRDNMGHWSSGSSASQNEVLSPPSSDCLLNALRQELCARDIDTSGVSRESLASFMRADWRFGYFVAKGCHNAYHAMGGFGGVPSSGMAVKWELQGSQKQRTLVNISQERQRHIHNSTMAFREGEFARENARVFPAEDMGCVTMVATETEETSGVAKRVPKFVQAKISKEYLGSFEKSGIPQKLQELVREQVGERGDNGESYQRGNNVLAWMLGGPALFFNFGQKNNQRVNNGMEKSLVMDISKWLKAAGQGAEVEVNTLIESQPNNLFPVSHSSHVIYRLNGKVQREFCVRMVNDARFGLSIPDFSQPKIPPRRERDLRNKN